MAERPNFQRTDQYAERIQKVLMPGAEQLPAPVLSLNDETTMYTYRLPDAREVVMKIAIPAAYLDKDDPEKAHAEAVRNVTREGRTIEAIRNGIEKRASLFSADSPGTHLRRPSVWVPEVYFNDRGILIREFMEGQIVSSVEDLVDLDEVDERGRPDPLGTLNRYGRDIMTISEGLGYAGWKAVKMNGDTPENPRDLEIRTRLLVHHSPHTKQTVLSPLGYDHVRNSRDPEYHALAHEDRDHLLWLHAMARQWHKMTK